MTDARFEDGEDAPLRLRASTPEDLKVLSALVQDAVLPVSEVTWSRRALRFAALINRFRWEDHKAAKAAGRPFERVRSMLIVNGALSAASNGVDARDMDLVLSILSLEFEPGEEGAGRLRIVLAGDGEIALEVECIEVTLTDVTRPYAAPSGKAPDHG